METGARRPVTDAELLHAVADGDRLALRELYDRHAPGCIARLRRRCADPTIVHDTVQDTFMAVWKGASGYDGRGEVAAWIWGIGVRRLIGQFRKAPRPTIALAENDQDEALLVSAEEQVLGAVEHGDLADALNDLSPELRIGRAGHRARRADHP